MMAVTGAARPAAPPAMPSATSRTAEIPASLWAKSTMTIRDPSRKMLSRPGERSVVGRKSARPCATCSIVAPSARAPAAAASAFATLCRASPPMVIGISRIATIARDRTSRRARPASHRGRDTRDRRRRGGGRPRAASPRSRRAQPGADAARDAATYRSSPLRTTQPSGFVIRQIVAFTSASSGSVWMPWRSRWSDETLVRTLASFDS